MTAMIGSADCPPARLAATRDGLHRVAEHLLAAARYAASGEIALVPAPGGFRTPPFGPDGRFLAVDGTELVVGDAATTRRTALTTIRAAADFAAARSTSRSPAMITSARSAAFLRSSAGASATVTTMGGVIAAVKKSESQSSRHERDSTATGRSSGP